MLKNTISLLSKLFHWLIGLLQRHLRVLYSDLDPVRDCTTYKLEVPNVPVPERPTSRFPSLNFHYIFPFAIVSFIGLDSLFVLYENGFHYTPNGLPKLFSHLVIPKGYWTQGDPIMYIGYAMVLANVSCHLFGPVLHFKYLMFLSKNEGNEIQIISNHKSLNQAEAAQIYNFRRKAKPFFLVLMAVVMCYMQYFFLTQFFYHNWNRTNWIRNCIFSFVIPFYFLYGIICNAFMLYYFIMTARYIRIKQKFVFLKKPVSLKGKTRINQLASYFQWKRLLNNHGSFLTILDEIRGQNRFWCKYLTIYFVCYIMEICYATYSFFFVNPINIGTLQRYFFLFMCIEFVLVLLVVTYECSMIVHQNGEIQKEIGKFSFRYKLNLNVNRREIPNLLKIDNLEANRSQITKISFTLINNYLINSRMFEMLFSYISLFFMMIFQKQN